mgnify:CR=1 FL=1
MLKNIINKRQGITLIALVVTIIVLLILAGVSISMLTGQNGILNRAKDAKEKTELAQKEENEKMQGYEDIINRYNDLPAKEETKPYYPNSTFGYKEGDLNSGLVIKDSDGNEYVWVEVPTTIYTDIKYNITGTTITENEWEKIRDCLKAYTSDYSNSSYKDTDTDGTTYSNDYKDMLKSVYKNGGFWIGRYETGYEINKSKGETIRDYGIDYDTEHLITQKAVIKKDAYPYNWVRRDQAQTLAGSMNYDGVTSSLIYGVQWDLVLKYIETKNATTKSNLTTDSTKIGNYYNSKFTLNRGKFAQYNALSNWFDYNSEEKKALVTGNQKQVQSSKTNAILLTTGATEDTKLQNIYDIAGNVWEWTLEFYSTSNPWVYRGGRCYGIGSSIPAKERSSCIIDSCDNLIGFRIVLWR